MVLAMFQQNTADHDDLTNSSYPQDVSSSSLSRIAVWKAVYAQHRSRLRTIWERTLEIQSSSPGEGSQLEHPHRAAGGGADLATPGTESDRDGSAAFPSQPQEDVGLTAKPEDVPNKNMNARALPTGTLHLGGVDLSSNLGNRQPSGDVDASVSQRPRQLLNESPSTSR
ncbi:uncharacterized protein LOC142577814 [Dermacentor variabilis]|uniref:uncharacterized protein LOC142577814 n=1 Tax=Dermacentor variabilis TaxID=34621 RepID=UPI003F5B998A